MTRQKFEQRRLLLRGTEQVGRAIALLRNVPLDDQNPLEVVVREQIKARKPDQNALLWAGPLRDIAEQCWIDGRQFSAEVWHQYLKEQFLPEQHDTELCANEAYQKWSIGPDGNRILTGSTKDLTIKGFAQHIEQIHAFGAQHGVEFHEPTRD